jgi:hypothetical protein
MAKDDRELKLEPFSGYFFSFSNTCESSNFSICSPVRIPAGGKNQLQKLP